MDVCCKMKRMDNVTRSPLFGHVAATVNGLQTIHAYNRERDFLTEFVFYSISVTFPLLLSHHYIPEQ